MSKNKPKRNRVGANPEFAAAMQLLRRSSAASAIPARKVRRENTRAAVRSAAIREF